MLLEGTTTNMQLEQYYFFARGKLLEAISHPTPKLRNTESKYPNPLYMLVGSDKLQTNIIQN